MHKTYIEKIISSKNNDAMEKLKDIMIDIIDCVEKDNKEKYNKIEKELYEICEGKVLTREKAEKIIQSMKPYGMRWSLGETEDIRKDKNIGNVTPVDFWIVMNSAYNDYRNVFGDDIDMYAKYSKEFISDEDAIDCKVYEYFTTIPKNIDK